MLISINGSTVTSRSVLAVRATSRRPLHKNSRPSSRSSASEGLAANDDSDEPPRHDRGAERVPSGGRCVTPNVAERSRAEQDLRAIDGGLLDAINHLAAGVEPPPGIPFGVLSQD